ncbi:MAG: outer membrane beta-barrel protein [Saprospiraceae bacterium]
MRIFLWSILLCLMASQLPAQTFKAALVGGFNLSQIDGDRLGGFHKIGVNTGVKAVAVFSDRWELSVEMLFVQQGSSRSRTDSPLSLFDHINLNLVEAPIMLSFRDWKVQAEAGFSYSNIINYKVISAIGDDISDQEKYKSNIFTGILGASYFFTDKWTLNIRWAKNLASFQDRVGGDPFFGRVVSIRGLYWL